MGRSVHLRRLARRARHHHHAPISPAGHPRHPHERGHRRGDLRRHRRLGRRPRQLHLQLVVALVGLVLLAATGCGGDGTTETSSEPASLTTFSYEGIQLPQSSSDGPETKQPFPRGYAHTETGAALAAINTTVVLDTASDDEWGAALSALVINNDGYQQWATSRQQVSVNPQRSSAAKVTIAGYRVLGADDAAARIEVYTTYPDGSHARLTRTVQWSGADWKLVLPTDDSEPVIAAVTEFPDGMVTL
ncbi:hypothetical protein AAFP30_27955 [Gordonia sp. CPCC 205515]|uniref:hypothetical protein n=1 Tax=Gordonia sp. CPCC 205515 TaxID=3140791 RepID=UPI003AF3BCC6